MDHNGSELSPSDTFRFETLGALVAVGALACGGGGGPTEPGPEPPPGPGTDETGRIDANVTNGEEPVEGADVLLFDAGGAALDTATSGTDGQVSFSDLEAGPHDVEVEPVEPYVQGPNAASRKTVSVESGATTEVALPLFLTVTDVDGNIYRTVRIGEQRWTAENLRVTHYRNGDPVPRRQSVEAWKDARISGTGAWVYYDNDPSNVEAYGRLYNQHAVADPRGLCPQGWHVPTEDEWQALESTLGMSEEAIQDTLWRGGEDALGGKLKSRKTEPSPHTGWSGANLGATNETGFTAVPNGFRVGKPLEASQTEGEFNRLGDEAPFWSSTPFGSRFWARSVKTDERGIYRQAADGFGLAVRCVQD